MELWNYARTFIDKLLGLKWISTWYPCSEAFSSAASSRNCLRLFFNFSVVQVEPKASSHTLPNLFLKSSRAQHIAVPWKANPSSAEGPWLCENGACCPKVSILISNFLLGGKTLRFNIFSTIVSFPKQLPLLKRSTFQCLHHPSRQSSCRYLCPLFYTLWFQDQQRRGSLINTSLCAS